MTGARIAGLVLAAGAGRRLGTPKAPVVVGGERLVDRAVRVLAEAGCDPVVVVLGAWVGDVPGATVVVNPGWETGMGGSLRCGLEALRLIDPVPDGVAVTLVDLPEMTGAAVSRVVAAAHASAAGETTALAAATYDGVRGHPVVLGREHWDPVIASIGADAGARDYLAAHPASTIEVGDVAGSSDLDTAADLERITAPGSGR